MGEFLANMMCLTLRQHQRHGINAETNILKASLPEQIKHGGKKPLAQVYTLIDIKTV